MAESKGSTKSSGKSSDDGKVNPRDVAVHAVEEVHDLIGRPVESITGIEKDGDEWKVTLEVLELERIPTTTDVLGRYEVRLDGEGELLGVQRTRRYPRAEAGED
jgi:hypothetical protein